MPEVKKCGGDGQAKAPHWLLLTEFGSDSTREDGLCVYCRSCLASRQRQWKAANREKVLASKRDYRKRMKEKHAPAR